MTGQLFIAICGFGLSLIHAIISLVRFFLKRSINKAEQKKQKFNNTISKIWEPNYRYYYEKVYNYYCNKKVDGKPILHDSTYNINGEEIIQSNWLIMVDDICIDNPKTVEDLPRLCDVKINYDKNRVKNSILIDKNDLPLKNKTFLECYIEVGGHKLHNYDSYFLSGFDKDTKTYTVYENGYNDYIESGVYLEFDLGKNEYKNFTDSKLTDLREKIDLMNFKNRNVGIGVCCLTIFKNVYNPKTKINDGMYFILHFRKDGLTEHPSQVSIIPAGTFEPNDGNYGSKENLDFSKTIYREFVEELYGADDYENLNDNGLLESGEIKSIKEASELYYLGSGIDIINGKLEVLSCMVIDVPKWDKSFAKMEINKILSSFSLNHEGQKLEPREFAKERLRSYSASYLSSHNFVPCAKQIFSILLTLKEMGIVL